jgi:hypothetical protein
MDGRHGAGSQMILIGTDEAEERFLKRLYA